MPVQSIHFYQAILLGVYFWVASSNLGYAVYWNQPLFTGLISGLILGDMTQGIKVGAYVYPMLFAFDGYSIRDPLVMTIVSSSLTIAGKLPIAQSISLFVPFVLFFNQIGIVRRIWFSAAATGADKAAQKGNVQGVLFFGSWFCFLSRALLYGFPMVVFLLTGPQSVSKLMYDIPVWATNALSAIGGLLPALGIAKALRAMGRPILLPFFFGAFLFTQGLNIGGFFMAVTGLFVTFLYYLIQKASNKTPPPKSNPPVIGMESPNESAMHLISKKDVTRLFFRWWWFSEQSNSFARMQGVAFCCAFIPALKKLYGNDDGQFKEALQRHLMFFNTQGIWGVFIHGIVLNMEERHAMGIGISDEAIHGVKTGLMMPLAGIGDTINGSTIYPFISVMLIPLASRGSALAPILHVVLLLGLYITQGVVFCHMGYRFGAGILQRLQTSESLRIFMRCAQVFGLIMLGYVGATFIKATTPIWIATNNTQLPFVLQTDLLNAIIPGLFPLAAIFIPYRALQKGESVVRVTIWFMVIAIILSVAGVIGSGGLIFAAR